MKKSEFKRLEQLARSIIKLEESMSFLSSKSLAYRELSATRGELIGEIYARSPRYADDFFSMVYAKKHRDKYTEGLWLEHKAYDFEGEKYRKMIGFAYIIGIRNDPYFLEDIPF